MEFECIPFRYAARGRVFCNTRLWGDFAVCFPPPGPEVKGLGMIKGKMTPHWKGTAETGRKKDLILELLAQGRSLYSIYLSEKIAQCVVMAWRRKDAAFHTACSRAIRISAELRARQRNRIKEERQAEQERRLAMWRPVNRIAP
jgi:hypothetical protein